MKEYDNLNSIKFLKKIMKGYGIDKKEMFYNAIKIIESSQDVFKHTYYNGTYWSVENINKFTILIDINIINRNN